MSRFESGGAAAIGVAVSRDGGRRWRTRALPTGAGSTDRVSDPVVAWDAKHRVWLVATLSGRPGLASAIRVSRSSDLLRWEAVTVARSPVFRFDKEWIACDNGPGSPYRGRCHIAYTDTIARTIVARTSDDGGATWRSPVVVGPPADGQVGAVPVTTPDGRLVISWLRGLRTQVAAVSTDGGRTFRLPRRVATVSSHRLPGVRSVEIPSVAVGPDGSIAVICNGCATDRCPRNTVMISRSDDGASWSKPRSVVGVEGSVFAPAIATSASGASAIVLYALGPGGVDAWVALTTGNDGRVGKPVLLSAQPMPLEWIARSSLGAMLGDYIGIAYVGDAPLAVLPLAGPPRQATLRQPLFAGIVDR